MKHQFICRILFKRFSHLVSEENFKNLLFSKNIKEIRKNVRLNFNDLKEKDNSNSLNESDDISNYSLNELNVKIKNNLNLTKSLIRMHNYNFSSDKMYKLIFKNLGRINDYVVNINDKLDKIEPNTLSYSEERISPKESEKNLVKLNNKLFLFHYDFINLTSICKNKQFTKFILKNNYILSNITYMQNICKNIFTQKIFSNLKHSEKINFLYFFSFLLKNKILFTRTERGKQIAPSNSSFENQMLISNFYKELSNFVEDVLKFTNDNFLHEKFLKTLMNVISTEKNKSAKVLVNYIDKIIHKDKLKDIKNNLLILKTLDLMTKEVQNNEIIGKYTQFKRKLIESLDLQSVSLPYLLMLFKYQNAIELQLKNGIYETNSLFLKSILERLSSKISVNTEGANLIYNLNTNTKIFCLYFISKYSMNLPELIGENRYNFRGLMEENFIEFREYLSKKIEEDIKTKNKKTSKVKSQLLEFLQSLMSHTQERKYLDMQYEIRVLGLFNNETKISSRK